MDGLDHLVAGLSAVRAPTLLLADPLDTLIPVETAYALATVLPNAQLQLVEGAGHHLPRRASRVVVDAICPLPRHTPRLTQPRSSGSC